MTKAALIQATKEKAEKATPAVRRVFFRGLKYGTKAQLRGKLKRMHVT